MAPRFPSCGHHAHTDAHAHACTVTAAASVRCPRQAGSGTLPGSAMGRGGARRRVARQHTLARVLAKTAHQARRGASTSLNAASERHAPSRRAPPRAPPARTPHRTQPAEDDFDFRGHAGRVLRLHVLIGDVEGRQHIAARGQLRVRVRLHHPGSQEPGRQLKRTTPSLRPLPRTPNFVGEQSSAAVRVHHERRPWWG